MGLAAMTGRSRRATSGCRTTVSRIEVSRSSTRSAKSASACSRCWRRVCETCPTTAPRTGPDRLFTCARSSVAYRADRAPSAAPSYPASAGSSPRICSMTVLHQARSSSAGAAAGSIRRVARSSTSDPSPADRSRCSSPVRSGRSERAPVSDRSRVSRSVSVANGRLDRPPPPGVVTEDLVERVEVGAHGGELLLDVLEAVGQPRPAAGRAVRLPDLALRLHLEEAPRAGRRRAGRGGPCPWTACAAVDAASSPCRRRAPRATPWWRWRRRGRRRCARRRWAGTRRGPRGRRRAWSAARPTRRRWSPASARSRRRPARCARPARAGWSRAGARCRRTALSASARVRRSAPYQGVSVGRTRNAPSSPACTRTPASSVRRGASSTRATSGDRRTVVFGVGRVEVRRASCWRASYAETPQGARSACSAST